MKTLAIREFGKKYEKNMNEAPLIITKGGKKAFVILPYSNENEAKKLSNYPIENNVYSESSFSKQIVSPSISLKQKLKKLLLTKLF